MLRTMLRRGTLFLTLLPAIFVGSWPNSKNFERQGPEHNLRVCRSHIPSVELFPRRCTHRRIARAAGGHARPTVQHANIKWTVRRSKASKPGVPLPFANPLMTGEPISPVMHLTTHHGGSGVGGVGVYERAGRSAWRAPRLRWTRVW
jgi:hypothetical protein